MPLESSPISPVDDSGELGVDLFNNLLTVLTLGWWEARQWEIGD